MAQFDEHILQAKSNLKFLEGINANCSTFYDWQVTTCFYSAVHLINAHLSLFGMQYRKHVDVKDAINPKNPESIKDGTALPDREYLAYTKLQSLSRRSRYLVNEKDGNLAANSAFLTHSIHLCKALRHLHTLFNYFTKQHETVIKIELIKVSCEGIINGELCFAIK